MGGITYLIANHNRGRYIRDCLQSLREQSDARWIALIGDDASTDGSLETIEPLLSGRVRLVRNQTNLGYIETLRRLIAVAPTDIVGILDPDDALHPEATAHLLRAYADDPTAGFVYSRFGVYDEALRRCAGVYGSEVPPGKTTLQAGFVGAIRTFRRSAYLRTEGLDPAMLYAEDRDLVLKLEEVAMPVFLPEALYLYRTVPGSQSRDPDKRELGARNAHRAKRAALRRRGIRGLRRLFYELFFWSEYLSYTNRRIAVVKGIGKSAVRLMALLDLHLHVRCAGRLRRADPGPAPVPLPVGRTRAV